MKSKHLVNVLISSVRQLPLSGSQCVSESVRFLLAPQCHYYSSSAKVENPVLDRYTQFVASKQLLFDKHQHEAAVKLNTFYKKLMAADVSHFNNSSAASTRNISKLVKNFFKFIKREDPVTEDRARREKIIRSVYLYGGVGINFKKP